MTEVAKRAKSEASSKRSPVKKGAQKTPSAVGEKKESAKKPAARKVAGRSTSSAKRRPAKTAQPARSKPKVAKKGTIKKTAARKTANKITKARAKKESPVARDARSPVTQDETQFSETTRPIPKTHLSTEELREFTELLLDKRAELAGDVKRLTNEALNSKGPEHGEHSAMPIHMADLGTDNWEQEFTLGLLANEQALIREIDEALARIENKTYGICLAMHKKISKARLRAQPWAKYCIAYARVLEEGRPG